MKKYILTLVLGLICAVGFAQDYVVVNQGAVQHKYLLKEVTAINHTFDGVTIVQDDRMDSYNVADVVSIVFSQVDDSNLPKLAVVNNANEYWDQLIIENTDRYACVKHYSDGSSLVVGELDEVQMIISLDAQNRPTQMSFDGFVANIFYRSDKAFAYCVANNIMYCDTISLNNTNNRLFANNNQASNIFTYLQTWFSESGLRYIVNVGVDQSTNVPLLSILLDYLRETDGMNPDEWSNYMINVYDNLEAYLASLATMGWIPEEWFEDLFNRLKDHSDEQEKILSTLIVGLITGNAPYIYGHTATCLVDGYLRAIANESSFDFEYGICYSENDNPTLDDFVCKKSVKSSGLIDDITLSLPEKFILTNLKKETKYYYRAYFKDKINNIVDYSNITRNFTTSDIPASITNFAQTNSYYNKNGYANNGNTYLYKYMTVLKVELESWEDILDWGYYYIDESGNRVAFSMMSRNSLRCDDVLEYYSNLPETTISLGCYVKYESLGDIAYYGDPQDYKLKYNDSINLSFTNCNFIEVTHDNSLGYYRCGVTFDVTFSVQGGQDLTSIVILPYGNFIAWNAASYSNPSDGVYSTVITDQYMYEYGLSGNYYCYLFARDVNGNEYYSDNMIRLYHDGYHFTACVVQPWDALYSDTYNLKSMPIFKSIPKH